MRQALNLGGGIVVDTTTATASGGGLLDFALNYVARIANFGSSAADSRVGTARMFWRASTLYKLNAIRSNGGNLYQATQAGTSAVSGGPTGTTTANDGTVVWTYIGADPDRWQASHDYSAAAAGTVVTNLGAQYRLVTPGTSAASGGPNANNTNITDNTCVWARISQYFVDTVNGSDANAGTDSMLSKKTLPTAPTQLTPNVKYWIAAGSELPLSSLNRTGGLYYAQPWSIVTVYDTATGNEVRTHPNYYLRHLNSGTAGGPTAAELKSKYFTIRGDANSTLGSAIAAAGTPTAGAGGTAGGGSALLRGAYITGCPIGVNCQGTTNAIWRVEDCVLVNNGSQHEAFTGAPAGGSNLRLEGAGIGSSFARLYIQADGYGEDSIWMSVATQPKNWTFTDVVIRHRPAQVMNSAHSDGIQFGRYPGNATLRRVIIEHVMPETDLFDSGLGVDPVGAALIMDGSGTAGTNGLVIEDCIFASNLLALNMQDTFTMRRSLNYVRKLARDQTARVGALNNANPTMDGCLNVLVNANSDADALYLGAGPTATGAGFIEALTS
jgi:hypothetical protein